MGIKGSKTEQNLLKSFAGESQARNRYTFFASQARKEGLRTDRRHLRRDGGQREGTRPGVLRVPQGWTAWRSRRPIPRARSGRPRENLLAAAEGENEEWTQLYPTFAEVAKEEGFAEVAESFTEIAEVEEQHEIRYRKLLANVEAGRVFKRENTVKWHCRNCGYIHEGPEAPDLCPACKHAQAYYELWVEAY